MDVGGARGSEEDGDRDADEERAAAREMEEREEEEEEAEEEEEEEEEEEQGTRARTRKRAQMRELDYRVAEDGSIFAVDRPVGAPFGLPSLCHKLSTFK